MPNYMDLRSNNYLQINSKVKDYILYVIYYISEGSKSSTHYPGDKNRFDDSSKGLSSGIRSFA